MAYDKVLSSNSPKKLKSIDVKSQDLRGQLISLFRELIIASITLLLQECHCSVCGVAKGVLLLKRHILDGAINATFFFI